MINVYIIIIYYYFLLWIVSIDIDECVEIQGVCSNGDCLNLIGSFSCVCRNGYRLSPQKDQCLGKLLLCPVYRRFHVYQHVTSFSHMRSGKRTTATSFHRQNMCSVCANTLEYWSKYTNILNPTVREDTSVVCGQVWQIVRSVLGLKKQHDELSRSAVC